MKVPFFNYKKLYLKDKKLIDKAIKNVMSKGSFILQNELEQFEIQLAKYTGAKYAIGVANGTDALWLSMIACGLKKNDEVLMPSHTYVATPAAAKFIGVKSILVDIDKNHLMCLKDLKKKVTLKTKAIIPVQLNGRTMNMSKLVKFAEEEGLTIIEDSAQGLGSKFNNKMAGTFGLTGTYSFYPAKTLGCFGDGGAIVTSNNKIYNKLYEMRDHGRNKQGNYIRWGLNSRLDNLQAAILLEKLSLLKDEIIRRRSIAKIYNENLIDLKQITLPSKPNNNNINYDTYQNYEAKFLDRDQLQKFLFKKNIGTLIQWGGQPIHQIKSLGIEATLPETDKLFEKCLMLPMNTTLTDDQVYFVIKSIKDFYK